VMTEAGFLDIFVNNEAQTPVYYDNFTVVMRGGNVSEVNAYYPSGLLIPEATTAIGYLAEFNAYKYNNKEWQKETKWLDYGARMMDPVVGRWWTPDPLAEKYYHISPFAYALNNPVNMVDPDGRFPIHMHAQMVANAFRGTIMSYTALSNIKTGASTTADIAYASHKSVHLDNMEGYSSLASAYTNAINDFQKNMEMGTMFPFSYEKAGINLHTVADFYSHSNYIELYKGFAEANGLSMGIDKIPTFSEAMKNPELVKHLQDNGLKTGTYDTGYLEDKKRGKEGSHGAMNLDSNSSPAGKKSYNDNNTMHEAAMSAAQRELDELAKKQNGW